jgi:hypothetical protein
MCRIPIDETKWSSTKCMNAFITGFDVFIGKKINHIIVVDVDFDVFIG